MKQFIDDSCLLFIFIDEKKFEIINIQIDNTLILSNKNFVKKKTNN